MLDFDALATLTFDCYGTLIDWESGILDAVRPILEPLGLRQSDDEILATYAELETAEEAGPYRPYKVLLRSVVTRLGERLGFEVDARELDCLSSSIAGWRPFPDTVDSLRRLKTRFQLAIVSNIDRDLFEASARRLEVPFDWVVTAEDARAYKPSRAVFERALRTIGHPRERILHVAQSVYHDIVPAGALGLATVWVNRRHDKAGAGATPPATGTPDLEVPDLATLVREAGLG